MTRTLLAVDLSYQTHRAAAAHQKLTSADGEFTGGLYGFMVTLAKIIRDTGATHVVVTQDLKPYHRSTIYPQYKQLRRSTADQELKDKVATSKRQILEMLDVVGVPVVGVQGFESDDIIAHYVRKYRYRYQRVVAATNDSDLFQLLDPAGRFRVYRKDESDIWTYDGLFNETGLTPDEYMLASALMGTHNDVEGIPRVGEKTSVQAVKDPGKLRVYRERHGDLIDRNLRLIRLPFEGMPNLDLPAMGSFRHRDLYKFCSRYDVTTTKSMLDAFEQVCP